MSNTTEKLATDEYINKMYDSQLNSQKEQLTQNYNQAVSDLDATKEQNAQNLQKNLNTTAVENQRAQKNYNEVQNAYGLTSGAMAQARLAQDNQLQADLTALRTAQATADAGIERERALLSQQYTSAIAQAQADNDLARAEALYKEAKDADAQLLAKQEGAAQLMAGVGDYSLLGQLYGLTDEQIAKLTPKSSGGRAPAGKKWNLYESEMNEIDGRVYKILTDEMYDNGNSSTPITSQQFAYVVKRMEDMGYEGEALEYAKAMANDYIVSGNK